MNVTASDWKRAYQSPRGLTVHPASPVVGARITGVDVSQPLSDAVFKDILDIWHQYLVIVFPGQTLDEDQMVAFAERFGPLNRSANPRAHHNKKNPAIMLISNIREDGKQIGALPDGEMHFHHDQIHSEIPHAGTLLYSVEIPTHGGDTLFADGYAAYDTLDPGLRAKLEGRRALNFYNYGSTMRGDTRGVGATNQAVHPVFRTHEDTGRKAIYVDRLMTQSIEDLSQVESNALLEAVFDHAEKPEFIYRHVWRLGDLIVWDNRCSMHARDDFPADQRRLMLRTTVQGTVRPY
jgi:taurine dioxygenase